MRWPHQQAPSMLTLMKSRLCDNWKSRDGVSTIPLFTTERSLPKDEKREFVKDPKDTILLAAGSPER